MKTFISRLKSLAVIMALSAGVAAVGAHTASAQEFKQIELTDKMVASFIAAQKDFAPLAGKLAEGGETPDAALTKELEDIAKKHGFASFAEFEDVGANITIILDGLDRSSGTYTDPVEKMKKELEEIKADGSIPPEDKKLAVDDLTQEIAAAKPLEHKSNIEVVKKHIAEIEALIPEEAGESGAADGETPAGEGPAP
ncbi:hypothetical protein [Hyphomicrobium sp.]|uniref:hypothetical protein n=1 Tax=Hyphomicrobium sp. TaxID=82 RepID=UPI002E30B539|nr:hypothetical protein [Hyphomicrobium sp.]HEX2840431.1 hypothetical protein [Hyphomicrobium sp.]